MSADSAHVVVIGMFLTSSESFRSPMVLYAARSDAPRVKSVQDPEETGGGGVAERAHAQALNRVAPPSASAAGCTAVHRDAARNRDQAAATTMKRWCCSGLQHSLVSKRVVGPEPNKNPLIYPPASLPSGCLSPRIHRRIQRPLYPLHRSLKRLHGRGVGYPHTLRRAEGVPGHQSNVRHLYEVPAHVRTIIKLQWTPSQSHYAVYVDLTCNRLAGPPCTGLGHDNAALL